MYRRCMVEKFGIIREGWNVATGWPGAVNSINHKIQMGIHQIRLTTGSGKSLPGLSHPGHGTGSGPGREGKGSSGTGPGSVPHGMGWARVTISAEGTGPVLLFHARDGTGK
jgi:hypothetical protein